MKEIVKFKGKTRMGFQTDKVPTKRKKDTHFFLTMYDSDESLCDMSTKQ